VRVLDATEEWLLCSLVHKFGRSEEADLDAFIQDIEAHLPRGFHAKGELFVFVDECHRTQSGKLHQAMKAIVPGAMLIGFHRHTAAQEGQAEEHRGLRTIYPHLQV
jgi:type I restriction enzyme R subunit